MVKRGGRTVIRTTEDVFGTRPVKSVSGGATVGAKFCQGVQEVYCQRRLELLRELIRPQPDHTKIGESYVDFKSASDMLEGGKCSLQCEEFTCSSLEELQKDI